MLFLYLFSGESSLNVTASIMAVKTSSEITNPMAASIFILIPHLAVNKFH